MSPNDADPADADLTDDQSRSAATSEVSPKTALVVGASRGLGRGVAQALHRAGASVIAVSRTTPVGLEAIHERADACDPTVPARLLDDHDPDLVVLVAGAVPHVRPLQQHTWETFSVHWHVDVKLAFHWLRESLLTPLRPGARVIVFSSGAALAGSPLSGGYAGSKATQRFITGYAQDEADRAGLDLLFTTVLPRITPATEVGRSGTRAYADRSGQTEAEFVAALGPLLTPAIAGEAVLDLARRPRRDLNAGYLLTGAGLMPAP